MVPMLGREVEEGEQCVPVLGQASDRLLVFRTIFLEENVDGGLRDCAGRCSINLSKVCLHVDLDREGDLVQHVGGLVNPTPLVSGARIDLIDGLPDGPRLGRRSWPTSPNDRRRYPWH